MMRRSLPILIGLLVATAVSAFAMVDGNDVLLYDRAPMKGEMWNDMPIRDTGGVRADTVWFGDYQIIGGEYYARSALNNRASVTWTFDRGNGPTNPPYPLIHNGAGFTSRDQTVNTQTWFRVIDNTLNLGAGVPAPIIAGTKSLWVGADKPEADALCWDCGAGYPNDWCQRVVSETLTYNGTGSVTLEFKYFMQTEPCYDGTQVYLVRSDNTEYMLNPYPAGTCANNVAYEGGFTDSIGHYTTPATYTRNIDTTEMAGTATYNIVIEFTSDGGWSDEDCQYATIWGPFGVDDITIVGGGENKSYNFESGIGSWTPGLCDPVGDYVGIADIDVIGYDILDPCACKLELNVIEMHQNTGNDGEHPVGQANWIQSPICDTQNNDVKNIFAIWDQYAVMPQENGVLYRPGWKYFPFTCEVTGATGWSERVGQNTWYYVGADPVCYTTSAGGTDLGVAGTPIPPTARMFRFIIELLGDCAAFTIENCTGETNFTPLIDNIVCGVTAGRFAPIVQTDTGYRFQDVGSYLEADPQGSALFNVRTPGPANTTRDIYMDNLAKPERCGDSLVVIGPIPTADPNTRWEAKMWWRVAKRSPFNADKENGVTSRYKTWKDRVADGKLIDRQYRPQFTWGWMDSNQVGFVVSRNKFISSFRENDDDFVGEGTPENEMIWDDVLYPGSRVDYFITSNYFSTPNLLYYYPDTAGGFFFEFEVLPGVRTAFVPNCGGAGLNFCAYHPATLYIDAHNGGSQFYIENALNTILNGAEPCTEEDGCDIPQDRNWDRYDYLDGSSNWNAPFARGSIAFSNAGMTLNQILGYRTIMKCYGNLGSGATEDWDYQLYDQWLISPLCNANTNRQVFLANGDKVGEVLENPSWTTGYGLSFLNNTLGATLECDAFNGVSEDPDCAPPSESYCLRWRPVTGGAFGTQVDVDVWGNYCPQLLGYNVLNTSGTGAGNRYYEAEDGSKTDQYAQITNENLLSSANYRTVLDGAGWYHLTRRVAGNPVGERCPVTVPSIVDGSLSEIGAAMKWGFGVGSYDGIPKLTDVETLALCQGTWNLPSDVDEPGSLLVNRLFQNEPNPFNPRTSLKFSLAQNGPVQILIYDVNGRLVRTLVDGKLEAGTHSAVWDGTNDSGHKVGSGVFWAQMKAGSYASNKKMVILK